ncbi:hypothetical protein BC831DRAFT_445658 [Entophlyctis helioformis]|nr:hypothetical protein BC831DRAFT_445658 [Entophlyctis helioformis]
MALHTRPNRMAASRFSTLVVAVLALCACLLHSAAAALAPAPAPAPAPNGIRSISSSISSSSLNSLHGSPVQRRDAGVTGSAAGAHVAGALLVKRQGPTASPTRVVPTNPPPTLPPPVSPTLPPPTQSPTEPPVASSTRLTSAPPPTSAPTLAPSQTDDGLTLSPTGSSTSRASPTPTSSTSNASTGKSSTSTNLTVVFSVIGGAVLVGIVGIYIFRKTNLRPSASFKQRINPNYRNSILNFASMRRPPASADAGAGAGAGGMAPELTAMGNLGTRESTTHLAPYTYDAPPTANTYSHGTLTSNFSGYSAPPPTSGGGVIYPPVTTAAQGYAYNPHGPVTYTAPVHPGQYGQPPHGTAAAAAGGPNPYYDYEYYDHHAQTARGGQLPPQGPPSAGYDYSYQSRAPSHPQAPPSNYSGRY